MNVFGSALASLACIALTAGAACADDWSVDKARGTLEIQKGGVWQSVARGDVIADGTLIRTGQFSQASLVRGAERLDLAAMTMIVIHDRDGKRFTTVLQMAGQVEVEAEVLNVQHFAVETPYLAAVVKGTHFVVKVRRGAASVNVSRGLVQVDDTHGQTYLVPKGESIAVTRSGDVTASANVTTTGETTADAEGVAGAAHAAAGTTAAGHAATAALSAPGLAVASTAGQKSTVATAKLSTSGAGDHNPCAGNSGNENGKGNGNASCRSD